MNEEGLASVLDKMVGRKLVSWRMKGPEDDAVVFLEFGKEHHVMFYCDKKLNRLVCGTFEPIDEDTQRRYDAAPEAT